ncbi:hypothetical protein [Comamonas sp. JUb58]|uniref:hypothetical protein n=1 Tax=Comamonas sp. JUb58 TaxID=2485114 RepID=UPI0010E18128|nr:hypothetical protein [Comamonas sp. JUb58]TDS68866.1 hypothetical protein EDF71_1384 [Comamonas sp. JUb58]
MHAILSPIAASSSKRRSLQALASLALLASSLVVSLPAQASQLADVQIIDRSSGQRLPLYYHQGEYWVAGQPGSSYAVDIKNRSRGRILAVLSIDGINAISGQAAAAVPDDGYVLGSRQQWAIQGWRKSDQQVAAFYFSHSEDSYAARTGRPRDIGVIGVAVFREREPQPQPPILRNSEAQKSATPAAEASGADSADRAAPAMPPPSSPATSAVPHASVAAESRQAAAPAPVPPRLGTGHGALERSVTRTTEFHSASSSPAQIIRIRYDSYANLVAQGVIRAPQPAVQPAPRPFPASPSGYVPDPPAY